MKTIVYGNESFGFAPINASGAQKSFGTPVMIPGLVSTSAEFAQDSTKIYADDMVWASIKGAKERTLTVGLRYVPASYLRYLGYVAAANGGYSDSGIYENHCVFYETLEQDTDTGEETKTLHYFYSVKASQPTEESQTTEDTVEAQELEIEYDCIDSDFVVDGEGNSVGYFKITRTEENASLYDTFKTNVILPTANVE